MLYPYQVKDPPVLSCICLVFKGLHLHNWFRLVLGTFYFSFLWVSVWGITPFILFSIFSLLLMFYVISFHNLCKALWIVCTRKVLFTFSTECVCSNTVFECYWMMIRWRNKTAALGWFLIFCLQLIQSLLGYFQPLKWLKSSAEAELQDFSAVWKSCSVSHVVMFPRQQQRTTCRASGCI